MNTLRRGPAPAGPGAGACRAAKRLRLSAALVVLPFASNDFVAYQIALFLVYGIATQGVALCWGRLGFLPLGHALFFGLGAYLAGGTLKAAQQQPLWYLAPPLALLLPAVVAYVTARLVFARSHRSGPSSRSSRWR